jgi:high affinity Mn2+ porin
MLRLFTLLTLAAATLIAQDPAPSPEQRWNLHFQATSIGQYHDAFPALYSGALSLVNYPEADVSLTTTMFFGLRLGRNTYVYINPEIAGGRGFSGVNGIANFPNGEMPRVASATPKPYLARAYITQDIPLGDSRESFDDQENQLAGTRPERRYSVTIGRFTVTDFFDNNKYSHDPRTQFMGWGAMYNGAWDYPADTRGYTWGWVHELHMKRWSLRYGSVAEPRTANGLRFDRRIFVNRGDVFEGELRVTPKGHSGTIRALTYFNHTDSGYYAAALNLNPPDVTAVRSNGTLKYGFGLNVEQELSKDVGVFGRLGWNDGKTESFAYAIIDRLACAGVSVTGNRWHRPHDTAATAFTVVGISGVHGLYLTNGGYDFMIGDGTLRRGSEYTSESYYSAEVVKGLFATLNLQHITNPAYNRDRGAVWVGAFRLHLEFGK